MLTLNPPPRRLPGHRVGHKGAGRRRNSPISEVPVACIREVDTADRADTGTCCTGSMPDARSSSRARITSCRPPTRCRSCRRFRADDIRLLWLNKSYHVATLDNDKDLIVERVGGFFSEMAKGG